jgi:hypothetical protein
MSSKKEPQIEEQNKDKFFNNINSLEIDDEKENEEKNEQQDFEDNLQKKMDLEVEIQRNLIEYVSANYQQKPLCEFLTIQKVEQLMSLFT